MNDFAQWLTEAIKECGGASAACINLNNTDLKKQLKENGAMSQNWLDSGYAGDMNYLERMLEDKINPQQAFPEAKSVIVITNTNQWGELTATHPFPEPGPDKLVGYISAYAKEQDYHRTGHQILLKLHEKLQEKLGEFSADACVDTRPVFERLLATFCGLGIRGPNDILRTPENDVRAFIGTLFCDFEIPEVIREAKMRFPCKFCQNCVESCPTGAITTGEPFDSNKCISYLAIEKKGTLNKQERLMMDDWLFGCDWCTVV
ncbi:MAG: epoxyqueuosine reductase, partial [Lentisphaeraceae bacterium]|nr:epoxyqueuosine reductase [Lentisphaeraceae bacterium]